MQQCNFKQSWVARSGSDILVPKNEQTEKPECNEIHAPSSPYTARDSVPFSGSCILPSRTAALVSCS
jgi:hypothetical protein